MLLSFLIVDRYCTSGTRWFFVTATDVGDARQQLIDLEGLVEDDDLEGLDKAIEIIELPTHTDRAIEEITAPTTD